MDYDELVQRLRSSVPSVSPDDAADAIAALQARVAELEADREQYERTINQQEGMYSHCCDERMALRDQLAATRALLLEAHEWMDENTPKELCHRLYRALAGEQREGK